MSEDEKGSSGAAEGARRASGAAPDERTGRPRGRWSSKRKMAVVTELLRGTDLEQLTRRHGVTAATISGWRDAFLTGAEGALRSREVEVDDEEKQRLKSVVAEQALANELLRQKIRHLEAGLPLARRRWRTCVGPAACRRDPRLPGAGAAPHARRPTAFASPLAPSPAPPAHRRHHHLGP